MTFFKQWVFFKLMFLQKKQSSKQIRIKRELCKDQHMCCCATQFSHLVPVGVAITKTEIRGIKNSTKSLCGDPI